MKAKDLIALRHATRARRDTSRKQQPEHLTQAEAARLLGVRCNTYARYERGEIRITESKAKLIAHLLRGEIDVDDTDV